MATPTEHDREALVKRLGRWADLPVPELAKDVREAIAALTAQGGEQPADTVSVPREPTEAMINAFCSEWLKPVRGDRIHRIYKAMLTAAKEGKS